MTNEELVALKSQWKEEFLSELKANCKTGDSCPVCSREIKKINPHTMCVSKFTVLKHFAYICDILKYPLVRPSEAGDQLLTYDGKKHQSINNCREHTQRLSYFGLLDHIKSRGKGGYKINDTGRAFLRNEIQIPATVWVRDGIVEKVSEETVYAYAVTGVILDKAYYDEYPSFQRPIEDLQGLLDPTSLGN